MRIVRIMRGHQLLCEECAQSVGECRCREWEWWQNHMSGRLCPRCQSRLAQYPQNPQNPAKGKSYGGLTTGSETPSAEGRETGSRRRVAGLVSGRCEVFVSYAQGSSRWVTNQREVLLSLKRKPWKAGTHSPHLAQRESWRFWPSSTIMGGVLAPPPAVLTAGAGPESGSWKLRRIPPKSPESCPIGQRLHHQEIFFTPLTNPPSSSLPSGAAVG